MDIFSIGKMFDEEKKYEQSTHYYAEALKHNLRNREFIYYPYEELAKYYEHRLKDYRKAETVVKEALNIEENIFLREKLQYRLNRIKGKQRCQAQKLS